MQKLYEMLIESFYFMKASFSYIRMIEMAIEIYVSHKIVIVS